MYIHLYLACHRLKGHVNPVFYFRKDNTICFSCFCHFSVIFGWFHNIDILEYFLLYRKMAWNDDSEDEESVKYAEPALMVLNFLVSMKGRSGRSNGKDNAYYNDTTIFDLEENTINLENGVDEDENSESKKKTEAKNKKMKYHSINLEKGLDSDYELDSEDLKKEENPDKAIRTHLSQNYKNKIDYHLEVIRKEKSAQRKAERMQKQHLKRKNGGCFRWFFTVSLLK